MKAATRRVYCGLVLFMLLPGRSLYADDWRVGPGGNAARNSLSQERGPLLPERIWEEGLTAVIAQQAVIEGNIVAMARIQSLSDVLHGTLIVAHDLDNGDTLWTADLPVDFPESDWRNRVSAIRDGKVYATRSGNTNASFLYALDAASGSVVWKSEALLTETSTEGATFAPNGDPISTGESSVVRISSDDGTTVWETSRSCPTSGGCDPVVFDDRVYLWEAGGNGPVITAFDLETGSRLYSSRGLGGGIVQQVAPFVGPDGILYAPRTQNNPVTDSLFALTDTGGSFSVKWSVPLGYVPFATFGVGPDGSVYMYSPEYRLLRLDPLSGAVLDSSEIIESDFSQPRMAIDSDGSVFLTNGGFSEGAVYAFTPDLTLNWSGPIANVNVGGPAIGQGGIMIVCGVGTDVRAYQYKPVSVGDEPSDVVPTAANLHQNYPNPFNPTTTISFSVPAGKSSEVSLRIFDLLGREVGTLVNGNLPEGVYRRIWDGRGFPSGTYFYRLEVDSWSETKRMTLLK